MIGETTPATARTLPSRTENTDSTPNVSSTPRRKARRAVTATLPDEARDLLQRADKLVYLFPESYEGRKLVADGLTGRLTAVDVATLVLGETPAGAARAATVHTILGRLGGAPFAVVVRPRSATIVAESFGARRDLLLAVKAHVEGRTSAPAA